MKEPVTTVKSRIQSTTSLIISVTMMKSTPSRWYSETNGIHAEPITMTLSAITTWYASYRSRAVEKYSSSSASLPERRW